MRGIDHDADPVERELAREGALREGDVAAGSVVETLGAPDVKARRPVAIERPWGAFERRFLLPAGGRASEMKARISGGVLELRIPLERSGIEREQKIDVE